MVRCSDCVLAFQAPGRGGCPLGRTLQEERAARPAGHDCPMFRGREVIAASKKQGRKDVPQEGLF